MSVTGYDQTGQQMPDQSSVPLSCSVQREREKKVNARIILHEPEHSNQSEIKPGLSRTCRVPSDLGLC